MLVQLQDPTQDQPPPPILPPRNPEPHGPHTIPNGPGETCVKYKQLTIVKMFLYPCFLLIQLQDPTQDQPPPQVPPPRPPPVHIPGSIPNGPGYTCVKYKHK